MKPFKTLIVEDEPKSAALLKNMLGNYPGTFRLVGMAATIAAAESCCMTEHPDLIFLDVELPDGKGFDLFRNYTGKIPHIIVTTAYEMYALPAIRCRVADYLLKPLDEGELAEAIKKIPVLEELPPAGRAQQPETIALPSFNGLFFIPLTSIIHCRSEGSYTRFIIKNHPEILVSRNIGEFEGLLPEAVFCRVHNEHIVNLAYVHQYIRGRGGYILLHNNTRIEIAARRKEQFLSRFR